MRSLHDHHSETGRQELAGACMAEAGRRGRPELAGDFFCQALHESREGRRNGYNARQLAWQAAGHLLQKMKKAAERTPPHIGGDAVLAMTRTDSGAAHVRQMEFAFDLYNAIGAQLARYRMQRLLEQRKSLRPMLTTSRATMPTVQICSGPLREHVAHRRDRLAR